MLSMEGTVALPSTNKAGLHEKKIWNKGKKKNEKQRNNDPTHCDVEEKTKMLKDVCPSVFFVLAQHKHRVALRTGAAEVLPIPDRSNGRVCFFNRFWCTFEEGWWAPCLAIPNVPCCWRAASSDPHRGCCCRVLKRTERRKRDVATVCELRTLVVTFPWGKQRCCCSGRCSSRGCSGNRKKWKTKTINKGGPEFREREEGDATAARRD